MCFAMNSSISQVANRTVHGPQTLRMSLVNVSTANHSRSFIDQLSSTSTYDTKSKSLSDCRLGKNFQGLCLWSSLEKQFEVEIGKQSNAIYWELLVGCADSEVPKSKFSTNIGYRLSRAKNYLKIVQSNLSRYLNNFRNSHLFEYHSHLPFQYFQDPNVQNDFSLSCLLLRLKFKMILTSKVHCKVVVACKS